MSDGFIKPLLMTEEETLVQGSFKDIDQDSGPSDDPCDIIKVKV